ncbi:hypothetical protein [Komagataeibacter xylinus]|uniref:hypothetical protein n=1 Tax=Komagataeibacter xylinus TaxID=28448 RepID=UPI001030878F|nr:hypothetical protein [Komagataeibacter xylinus]
MIRIKQKWRHLNIKYKNIGFFYLLYFKNNSFSKYLDHIEITNMNILHTISKQYSNQPSFLPVGTILNWFSTSWTDHPHQKAHRKDLFRHFDRVTGLPFSSTPGGGGNRRHTIKYVRPVPNHHACTAFDANAGICLPLCRAWFAARSKRT